MDSSHNRIFIFLDIDGVLNTASQWKRMYQLDDGCIARFNEYILTLSNKGSVRIILTSSWKNGFDPAGHHTPQIQELIAKLNIPILGKTENRTDGDRAAEINDYIRNHKLEHTKCIVIDDDPDLFKSKLFENCKFFSQTPVLALIILKDRPRTIRASRREYFVFSTNLLLSVLN